MALKTFVDIDWVLDDSKEIEVIDETLNQIRRSLMALDRTNRTNSFN